MIRLHVYEAKNALRRLLNELRPNPHEVRRLDFITSDDGPRVPDECCHAAWVARECLRVERAARAAAESARTLFYATALPDRTQEQADSLWKQIVDGKE